MPDINFKFLLEVSSGSFKADVILVLLHRFYTRGFTSGAYNARHKLQIFTSGSFKTDVVLVLLHRFYTRGFTSGAYNARLKLKMLWLDRFCT